MRTASRPKKPRGRRYGGRTSPHQLVDAGNPPHRHTACAAAHRACPYHCLVALEAVRSSRRKALIPETKNATVVLGSVDIYRAATTAATRLMLALKLSAVLSYRVAMERNSLILAK